MAPLLQDQAAYVPPDSATNLTKYYHTGYGENLKHQNEYLEYTIVKWKDKILAFFIFSVRCASIR